MTRFLYRADIKEVAGYLNEQTDIRDFGITGLLAGPWDKIALNINIERSDDQPVKPRWYDPRRVLLLEPAISFAGFPDVDHGYEENRVLIPEADPLGGYQLYESIPGAFLTDDSQAVCFENGLCWLSAVYDPVEATLDLVWQVEEPLDLPEIPLISNPPPPGVYAGPRLYTFAQLLDEQGTFLVGDDGFWVDPLTLHPGDTFVQRHRLAGADALTGVAAVFGLYDPKTGERILTIDGADHIRTELPE
jgi:hypothetical protein